MPNLLPKFRKPEFSAKKRRVKRSLTIYDLRDAAKSCTPTPAFDYTDGAAEDEISLQRARDAYRNVEFQPNVLKDVSKLDTSIDLFGQKSSYPLGIAPTGFTRMMNTEGEVAGSRAAAKFGIPFCLSTMGTTSIEDVVKAAPTGRNMFQLYMWKDREKSMALVDRAAKAGVDTLVLTVDVPIAGARLRDVRNGLTVPPTLTLKTMLNAAPRIGWWWNFLTKPKLEFASLGEWPGTVAELIDSMFDPTIDYQDLKWIRGYWKGNLVIKGIQTIEDAKLAFNHGVDAIVLSNHGGRQLDRAPVPLYQLQDTVKAVGRDKPIHIDTGIMHGADVVTALAHGAKFAWVGRAYLYGLMAGGQLGAERTLEILTTQMKRTMKLLGVSEVAELEPKHVKFLQ
ncbi:MAG: alpha-hydroxy-acid oxidizing protein [Actinobacteria bacterium]|nr:alpha-hydroxy-acid oxidizing protein [Actinomycetota bacterium]